MGKIIKGVLVVLIFLSCAKEVKGEQVIEIVIPDEIKLCKCGCGCKQNKIPLNPRNTTETDEDTDILALQRIAVAEAGNTDIYTMAYVMQTVLNRVASNQFPDTVEEVIKQKGQFSTYPSMYNNSEPNKKSLEAYNLLKDLENRNQLYFENTVEGSWQSTNLQWVFDCNVLSFYR